MRPSSLCVVAALVELAHGLISPRAAPRLPSTSGPPFGDPLRLHDWRPAPRRPLESGSASGVLASVSGAAVPLLFGAGAARADALTVGLAVDPMMSLDPRNFQPVS